MEMQKTVKMSRDPARERLDQGSFAGACVFKQTAMGYTMRKKFSV